MSTTYSAEETKQQHVDHMGRELGVLYHALWNELAWVEFKWHEYVDLYGTKESRITLINQAAGHFFKIVQDSLWDDTLLHIARLTDPAQSMSKENLSIKRLPTLLSDIQLKNEVSELIRVVDAKTEFCRDWRNRKIAHKDFELAMKLGAKPLKPASRAMIREALDSISGVLNAVSLHYMDSTTSFDNPIRTNGAASLLYVLDDGLKAEKERNERIKNGGYRSDDLENRDL